MSIPHEQGFISEWPEPPRETKPIFIDIIFRQSTRSDGLPRYVNSDPARKMIILDAGQPEPVEGQRYKVRVIRDTMPHTPLRGAFIVELLSDVPTTATASGVNASPVPSGEKPADLSQTPMKQEKTEPETIPPIEHDATADTVYIIETEVPYNKEGGPLVPRLARFRHFTLDQQTLETMEKAATAVALREPLLLEGETATSKTSVIEYLAAQGNYEVIRLNLNGQTDTSELIGKFVPSDDKLQITFEELLQHSDALHESSQRIMGRAHEEGRGLTLFECQKIAASEGLTVPDWKWQDGLDIQAKKKGQWLILDEMNLAEPQILERLNSQLEKDPSIVVSENGGVMIRELTQEEEKRHAEGALPGIEPLHPNFRIFATINPAEYAKRQTLSPAYRDRWTSYQYAQPPTEQSYRAMVDLMVYGEQPKVMMHSVSYQAPRAEPLLRNLERIPNFREFGAAIAKFQTRLEDLARKREIGRERKEPYVFTRRGLIELLTYCDKKIIVDRRTGRRTTVNDVPEIMILRAIQYYYLDKIVSPGDMQKVQDLLDAIGISDTKWKIQFR